MSLCWNCGEDSVILDPTTNSQVCSTCGTVHSTDDFRAQTFDADGRPTGTFTLSVGDFGYRERKLRDAKALISDLTARLGLSAPRAAEAESLISSATDGEFGAGAWFPVLVAACSYLVMRRHRLPLSLAEAAAAIGHTVHDLGQMVSRTARHLALDPLPEFEAGKALERAVISCPGLSGLGKEKLEELVGQGQFLLHCATKWFLTTGRQPLPMVAAVVVFVAEVNGTKVAVEEVASKIYAGVETSKARLRELRNTLLNAAKALLPWGADVTVKNLPQNAPLLIRFMEIKSKSNSRSGGDSPEQGLGFDLDDLLNAYAPPEQGDSNYFKAGIRSNMGVEWDQSAKLSGEALSRASKEVVERLARINGSGELGKNSRKKRRAGRGFDFEAFQEAWQLEGRWDSDKELTIEQVLERDVGYEALPPSFVSGVEARKSRRLRIGAAKARIDEFMNRPSATKPGLDAEEKDSVANKTVCRKRRRRGVVKDDIDWEDCIIELLLLHGVDEGEIEQGHYKRLVDLHIFNL